LRIAIADDEPMARLRLRRLLTARTDIEITGEYASGKALLAGVLHDAPDLILLDIEMPAMSGLSVVSQLPQPRPAIVFVTAYSDHAVRAFEIDAVDYLVKPVSAERLQEALARVRRSRLRSAEAAAVPTDSRIALPIGRRTQLLDPIAVECIVARGNYIEVVTCTRRLELRRSLHWIESRLDASLFVRVHRGCIVRAGAVVETRPLHSGRYELCLTHGARVVTGRSYRATVQAQFRAKHR
jgi:two-component system, LytTR family, response regulator